MHIPDPTGGGGINYSAILDTAADVARALLHLHRQQVRLYTTC
jgi:hypothetical protein